MNELKLQQLEYLHCGPLDLQVKSTECIGLSGASGSGKSQLLRVLADMEPHTGQVQLDELEQQSICAHQWRKKVALLPAETVWWFDTVGEHFADMPEKPLRQLGFEADVSGWNVSRLSSGEKQRLGLLRLLQNEPQVLLLDEPTANLDSSNEEFFEKFVRDYLDHHAACAIWVSHDDDQLQRVCTRRYILDDGAMSPC